MKPAFFIVPGFGTKASSKYFSWLASYMDKRGFRVVLVPIHWNNRVMADYIKEFKSFYTKHKAKTNYVYGHSYGSVITLCSANDLRPNNIFLGSLSPDFKEDLTVMKPWIRRFVGKKRLRDARSRSGRTFAKNLKVPSVVFYGEREGRQYPKLKVRCEETARLAKNSKLVIVPHAPHNPLYPTYQKAIIMELELLKV